MIEYTIIIVYNWSKYGDDIKEILHKNKLKWNSTKIKNLTKDEIINEYKRFKVDNYFKIDYDLDSNYGSDSNCGSSGIYETDKSNIMIKIIKSINDDKMLLIYRGDKEILYTTIIKKCRDIGCLVMKIIDDEIIFKNRINVELINSINNIQDEKNIKIRNFIKKTKILKEMNEIFSDNFKNRWINCIKIDTCDVK